ncbi:hypothetical protein GIW32_30455 [Pseudomonas syringae]|nr:hypothetical protein [Pseudomonas syringae]MCF5245606.1 hypothetical protein [Pseudomonas syringae]
MTSDVILQYETALQRLVDNKPTILPLGSKITINNVALEAGRGKGSIRKDRECFCSGQLIPDTTLRFFSY